MRASPRSATCLASIAVCDASCGAGAGTLDASRPFARRRRSRYAPRVIPSCLAAVREPRPRHADSHVASCFSVRRAAASTEGGSRVPVSSGGSGPSTSVRFSPAKANSARRMARRRRFITPPSQRTRTTPARSGTRQDSGTPRATTTTSATSSSASPGRRLRRTAERAARAASCTTSHTLSSVHPRVSTSRTQPPSVTARLPSQSSDDTLLLVRPMVSGRVVLDAEAEPTARCLHLPRWSRREAGASIRG